MEPHSRRASCDQGAETHLRVVVLDPAWHRFVPRAGALISRCARVAGLGVLKGASVVLADDHLLRELNARHRGRDKPTNILTYDSPAPEVVLALGVIRREAAAAGRRLSHHVAHLVVHGALHLLGYDHEHPGEARRMEMKEARLLHLLGVPNPWKPSAGTRI